jgi:hypothetical protein
MVRRRELGPLRWEPRPHLLPRVEVRRRELPERQRRRLTNGVATAPGPDQCENAQTQGTLRYKETCGSRECGRRALLPYAELQVKHQAVAPVTLADGLPGPPGRLCLPQLWPRPRRRRRHHPAEERRRRRRQRPRAAAATERRGDDVAGDVAGLAVALPDAYPRRRALAVHGHPLAQRQVAAGRPAGGLAAYDAPPRLEPVAEALALLRGRGARRHGLRGRHYDALR